MANENRLGGIIKVCQKIIGINLNNLSHVKLKLEPLRKQENFITLSTDEIIFSLSCWIFLTKFRSLLLFLV